MNKSEKRENRKQELAKMSVSELGNIQPYYKNKVTALKINPTIPGELSKEEMIETILQNEFGKP